MIRKAQEHDFKAVCALYEKAHEEEEAGFITTGWKRGIYPAEDTVRQALSRDDLFVCEHNGNIIAACIINHIQPDAYSSGKWRFSASSHEVMVLHTLYVDGAYAHHGCGREMIRFYEDYALVRGCPYLRIDTNKINTRARKLYARLGYTEIGIVPAVFNGIRNVNLVLLEKHII